MAFPGGYDVAANVEAHRDYIVRAADAGADLVVFPEIKRGSGPGVVYNTLVLTGPDGYVGRYRKVHVGITEQLLWRRGDDWPVFATAIGTIGMMICYDKCVAVVCAVRRRLPDVSDGHEGGGR